MLELFDGAIPTGDIYAKWEKISQEKNFGAYCTFTGIVRNENGIDGLSFDIYEPLLKTWFEKWEKIALTQKIIVCMAHSRGDVLNSECSYMSAILSSNRKSALQLYAEFIEDFKHNAPIWKYDLKQGKRIYAKERSYNLAHSGILG